MASLTIIFWVYVVVFAIIGGMRRWAKEIMVTFSVVLAIFIITVLETYVAPVKAIAAASDRTAMLWLRSSVLILLVFFGYQAPNIRAIGPPKFAREHLQAVLLGGLLGALNGYLIVGSLWWYINLAGYPYPDIIAAPVPSTATGQAAISMINYLAPNFLVVPWVYFAVGLAFVFVIVVFL